MLNIKAMYFVFVRTPEFLGEVAINDFLRALQELFQHFLEVHKKCYLIIYRAPLNSNVCWFYITTIETHVKFQIEICNYNNQ